MNERRKPYPFDRIEPKWQATWETDRSFHAPNPGEENFDPAKPKYYVLDKIRLAGITKIGYQIKSASVQGAPGTVPPPAAPPPPPKP